jgi:amino-acid N-acetyltransferase
MISYRKATPADRPAVLAILKLHNLPTADISPDLLHFVVAEKGGQLAGCVGLEVYGSDALVRSLAVDGVAQNQGVGNELLTRAIALSKTLGCKTLHLLTTTAREYFLKKGFRDERRDQGPELIRTSREFSELCPSTAVYMVRELSET